MKLRKNVITIALVLSMIMSSLMVIGNYAKKDVQAAPQFKIELDSDDNYLEYGGCGAYIDYGDEDFARNEINVRWSIPKEFQKYISLEDDTTNPSAYFRLKKAGTAKVQCKIVYKGKSYTLTKKIVIKQANALKTAKVGKKNYINSAKKRFDVGILSNEKSFKINFTPNNKWKIKKITGNYKKLKNNQTIKVGSKKYDYVVQVDLENSATKDIVSYEFRIIRYYSKQLVYGKPKAGTKLTLTCAWGKHTESVEAIYKKNPKSGVKLTGADVNKSYKAIVEFNSKSDLMKKLNLAFDGTGKASINKNIINLQLYKDGKGKWTIKVKNGNGMKVK